MNVTKSEITTFLKDYAKALSDGDLKTISASWHTPSLVVGPEEVITVSRSAEIESFFKASVADYREKGISGAELRSAEITKLSDPVATATVTWAYIAPDGRAVGEEHAFYVLSKLEPTAGLGIDLYAPPNEHI